MRFGNSDREMEWRWLGGGWCGCCEDVLDQRRVSRSTGGTGEYAGNKSVPIPLLRFRLRQVLRIPKIVLEFWPEEPYS